MGSFRRTTLAYETAEVNQERPFSEITHLIDELCGDMGNYVEYQRVSETVNYIIYVCCSRN